MYMLPFSEQPTQPGKPAEDSGVRKTVQKHERSSDQRHIAGLSGAEISRAIDAKVEEIHPEDPFEDVAPVLETDTTKVWGVKDPDALDKEDAVEDRKLIKSLLKQIDEEERRQAS